MRKINYKKIALILFFIGIFFVFACSRSPISTDSVLTMPLALNVVNEHTFNLDNFRHFFSPQSGAYRFYEDNGHAYSVYPLGMVITAVPFTFLLQQFVPNFDSKIYQYDYHFICNMEHLVASILMLISAILIYLVAKKVSHKTYVAIITTIIFSFGTAVWSISSTALWQHSGSVVLLSAILLLLLKIQKQLNLTPWLAVLIVTAFFFRPSNAITLLILSLYIFNNHQQYFLRFLFWGVLTILPFLCLNLIAFGHLFSAYSLCKYCMLSQPGSFENLPQALIGHWLSPSRGLLIFSPILIYSFYGVYLKIKNKLLQFDYYLMGIIIIHWLMISLFHDWWAGHAFGARYFTDVIPLFIYFLIPAIEKICNPKNYKLSFNFILFITLATVSIFAHYQGANNYNTWKWNYDPIDINQKPARVWDFTDIQYLR